MSDYKRQPSCTYGANGILQCNNKKIADCEPKRIDDTNKLIWYPSPSYKDRPSFLLTKNNPQTQYDASCYLNSSAQQK